MSQDEEKVLKDLVTKCLATKGFLGKIQAEIRAGVFVALEEQDVLKDIFINKPLKDFIETTHGALVISLVREFLEFFNLQFTNMVFDPETNAGIDYKFEGRKKLATDLNLDCEQDEDVPLLGLLLQSLDSCNNKYKTAVNGIESTDDLVVQNKVGETYMESNGFNKNEHVNSNENQNDKITNGEDNKITHGKLNGSGIDVPTVKKLDFPKEQTMASLSDLPPLNNSSQNDDSVSSKVDMKQLNELLQYEPDGGDTNYEEDFVSSESDKKDKTDSTESEVEEELPTISNHSTGDDLTADVTISKESGQGDYTEKLSNS